MAELKKLQKNGTDIYPVTLEDVVFDTDGNTLPNKYQTKSDDALNTVDKTVIGAINEVNTELAEVKQSVSNGKSLIASAITDKGIETLSDATFQTMADNIGLIEGNIQTTFPSWYLNTTDLWIEASNMTEARMGLTSQSYNNKIYCIGGYNENNYYNTNYCYDLISNIWEEKEPMPTARAYLCSGIVNDNIYCFEGYNGIDTLSVNQCYNILTDTWSNIKQTDSRCYHTCSVVKGLIYVIGGYYNTKSLNTNRCYDPNTDTWNTKTSMPTERHYLTSSVVNDKIYCIGGSIGTISSSTLNECYDPLTDTWTQKNGMNTKRAKLTSGVVDNKIYAICYSTVECYDVDLNTWEYKTNIITYREFATSSTINGNICVIGGQDKNSDIVATNEIYILK